MGSVTFTIASPTGAGSVTAILLGSAALSRVGGTSASAASGGGGWQTVDRSRKKAATEWLDVYPFVMTMKCVLDGGTGLTPVSVEPDCTTLESFELPATGTAPPLPPIVTVSGPVPHTELFWVCSRLSFPGGDDGAEIRNASGQRTQAAFSIELTEYSPSTAVISLLSPAQTAALNLGQSLNQTTVSPSGSTYTTVAGDTLQSIAATVMGNVSLWPNLALLNGLNNSTVLVPGTVLAIPAV